MSILDELSSQRGDRTENSNRKVVLRVLEEPHLLVEIAEGLTSENAALAGDCAEVLTKVAEQHPARIVPYAGALAAMLTHKNMRVRWEAAHALQLIARLVPAVIEISLAVLAEMIRTDPSVIARDHAVDTVANYAATSKSAAEKAYPLLKEALVVWESKQAGHALKGLAFVAGAVPELLSELKGIGEEFSLAERAVVRKEAKSLLKAASLL